MLVNYGWSPLKVFKKPCDPPLNTPTPPPPQAINNERSLRTVITFRTSTPSPFHQALETFRRYPFKPRVLLGSASGRFWLDSFTIPSCLIYGKFERVGGEDMRFSFPFTSSLPYLLTTPRKNCFSLPSNKEERWWLSPSRINHKYQVIARQKHAWRGTFESNVPRPRTKQNEVGLRPLMPPRLSRLLAKRHWVRKE